MTEDQIITFFGNGQVQDAIMLAKSNGFSKLAVNFEKAIQHVNDHDVYLKHYSQSNGRIPGAQIQNGGGSDFRQRAAMSHFRELNSETLLDVGCADGSFGFFCLKENIVKNVIGIDPWIEGIEWANRYFSKNKLRGNFVCGLFEDINLDNYSFDSVHLGEILEHVIDPVQILIRLRKYQLKGIVVTVPTERPPVNADEKIVLTDGRVAEHVRLISIQHLEGYCEKSGFKIIKKHTTGFGWVNLIATLK